MRVIIALLTGLALVVVVRLVIVQVIQHPQHEAAADRTWAIETKGTRGAILDRNGFPLATSIDSWEVHVDTRLWAQNQFQPTDASIRLAELLRTEEPVVRSLAAQVAADGVHDALIAYGLSKALAAQIHAESLFGVQVRQTSTRRYIEGAMAAPVIGLVGRDEQGLAGLEYQYDEVLGGEAGLLVQEVDGLGQPIPFGPRAELPYEEGATVVLSIDRNLQWLAESTLRQAVQDWDALGGHIIMMDPANGDILALASLPSYDPTTIDLNEPDSIGQTRPRAVTDVYEPGSTMKAITMAAALDAGLIAPDTTFTDTGAIVVANYIITNFDYSYHGEQTMTQVLQRSLNTGTVWVAEKLGASRFYDYIRKFGFGDTTQSGLPGESQGVLRDYSDIAWSPSELATHSFGQGLSVTPLQVVQAYATIARGGELVRPRLVTAVINEDGVERYEPVTGERAISQESAGVLTWMLQAVVDGVDPHPAQVPGWPVAGKSGTSDLVEGGTYIEGESIASFAGFAPADDPRVVVLVRIDRPQGDIYGGVVAAPIFADLMSQTLPYLGVPPTAYVADPDSWNTGPEDTPGSTGFLERNEYGDVVVPELFEKDDADKPAPITYIDSSTAAARAAQQRTSIDRGAIARDTAEREAAEADAVTELANDSADSEADP